MKLPCPTCSIIMTGLNPNWNSTLPANLYLACGSSVCPSAYILPTSNYIKINNDSKSEKYGFVFIEKDNQKRRWKLQGDVLIGKTELSDLSKLNLFNTPNVNTMTASGYTNVINAPVNITINSGVQVPFTPPITLYKPLISVPFVELALETDKFVDNVNYLFKRLKNMVIFS